MSQIEIDSRRSCIIRIQGTCNNLKSAEKRIAEYILKNTTVVIKMTINELAVGTNSSYASINRFCRKIGYSGYKELKNDLINDITNKQSSEEVTALEITSDMTTKIVCEKVYHLAFKILEDSLSIIDISIIDKVVDVMLNANKIFFLGTGASGISAYYAYSKYFRIGVNCFFENDTTLKMLQVGLLKEGDVLFAISSSGRTIDIVEAAKEAKKRGVTIISLSDFTISPLSRTSDYNLYTTPRNVGAFMNIDMPLTTGQITIIDMLYMCCCKMLGERATKSYELTKEFADSGKLK